jgi:hypothetical protein
LVKKQRKIKGDKSGKEEKKERKKERKRGSKKRGRAKNTFSLLCDIDFY